MKTPPNRILIIALVSVTFIISMIELYYYTNFKKADKTAFTSLVTIEQITEDHKNPEMAVARIAVIGNERISPISINYPFQKKAIKLSVGSPPFKMIYCPETMALYTLEDYSNKRISRDRSLIAALASLCFSMVLLLISNLRRKA